MDKNLQKYTAFVKTVEYGSFTKAAEILNYSQSGVSRMINDLENEWNLTLLERGKNGVKLTSEGLKLFPYAKSVCNEFDKMQNKIDEINGLKSGIIRIGTFSSIATHRLPQIIKSFQKDYPGIDYELLLGDYTEIEEWIEQGRVDCGFLRIPTKHKFETYFFEEDELRVILPKNHPFVNENVFPVEELCNYPFMLLEKGAKAEISQIFEKHKLIPNVKFITWDDYAVMSMVESGLGISILPSLILNRVPYDIVTKPLSIPAYRQIGVALRNSKDASVAVKKFLQYLNLKDYNK